MTYMWWERRPTMLGIIVTLMTCDTVIEIRRRKPHPVSGPDMATRTSDPDMYAEQFETSRCDHVVVLELCVCLTRRIVA